MANYSKFSLIVVGVIVAVSCDYNSVEPPINPESNLSDFEQSLLGTWQYLDIKTANATHTYADANSEPGSDLLRSFIGIRAELERRRVNYSRDRMYQLRWIDRGNYELGTEGDPNWQPNYGSWYHDPATDSVTHNIGLHYSIKYKITINGDLMERVSLRYMSSENDNRLNRNWQQGDSILFVENFIRLK